MAQALGARLPDPEGGALGFGGGALLRLARIDTSGLDPRLRRVRIGALDRHNRLSGPRGVLRVFGARKETGPEQRPLLEAALERRAEAIRATTGHDVAAMPGTGASGGLGAGLVAFAGATLHPHFELVLRYLDLDRLLEEADLVITAAGALDGQSPFGKVPCEVSRRAAAEGEPVIALAGTIGKGAATTFEHGIAAFASIVEGPCSLEEAIARAEKLLRRAAEDAMRMVRVGFALAGPRAA